VLLLFGILLSLFAIAAQGDTGPRIGFLALGLLAIFGAGILGILERRFRDQA